MSIVKLLNIKYPLIQGGMANIATSKLAAAVSNSGALGLIGTGAMDKEQVREEIKRCRELTDKPFGINIMLMNPHAEKIAKLAIEEEIKVVTTGAGNPGPYMDMWKNAGIIVIPVVPAVSLAIRMERLGADCVIAEGTEAGGHVGELTTMALVPQIVDAVKIPVIAAGGIADGRQLACAFILGAQGVQVGTCLLAAVECPIHDNYKNAVLKAKDTDTTVTGRISGVPVRIMKNKMSRRYLELEKKGATKEELEELTLGSLRQSVFFGDIENGSVMIGQVAGMINEIKPAKEIIESMFKEAENITMDLQNNMKNLLGE